jgi:hypothetical protein
MLLVRGLGFVVSLPLEMHLNCTLRPFDTRGRLPLFVIPEGRRGGLEGLTTDRCDVSETRRNEA